MAPSRRDLLSIVGSLAAWSLCQLAVSRRAAASTISPILIAWLRDVNDLARSLGAEALSQAQWRSQMLALYERVPLGDVLRLVDLEALVQRAPLPATGESFDELRLPRIDGLPDRPAFYSMIAGFRAGRSIPPHGHNHLVSSFLVLRGELHGRHFDRLQEEGDRVWIAMTGDRSYGPGDFSTVTQEHDNVHWFTARKDRSFVMDVGVGGLAAAGTLVPLEGQQPNKTGRIYLDVARGPGITQARRLSEAEAYRRYG